MPDLGAAVPHLFAFAAGLLVVLPLWFAGGARRLANVDYPRVADPASLNRWAAWRLLPLPLISAINAIATSLGWIESGIAWSAFAIAIAGCAIWILLGSRRFENRLPRPR